MIEKNRNNVRTMISTFYVYRNEQFYIHYVQVLLVRLRGGHYLEYYLLFIPALLYFIILYILQHVVAIQVFRPLYILY